MMQEAPDGLPGWFQIVLYVGGLIGAAAAAVIGWVRKQPAPHLDAANTLLAGDIMDTRPMKDLAHAVENVAANQERMIGAMDRVAASMDRVERAVRDQTEHSDRQGRK